MLGNCKKKKRLIIVPGMPSIVKQQLKELLKDSLTESEFSLIPSSYDIVGSIMIFSGFPEELCKKERLIGNAFIHLLKNVKTVCRKTKKYSGEYRTPKLRVIAGEKSKETAHKENGCTFRLDVEKVYFSPRSSTERKRIFSKVRPGESVLVMFSGCGPFPISIAKNTKAKDVFSVEINPAAAAYQEENIKINKIKNVRLFLGDAGKVLPTIKKKFDRIIMPLPKGAESFLPLALKKIKNRGVIHFYDFLAEGGFNKAAEKIGKACVKAKKKYKLLSITRCGQFSPRVCRICADFKVMPP